MVFGEGECEISILGYTLLALEPVGLLNAFIGTMEACDNRSTEGECSNEAYAASRQTGGGNASIIIVQPQGDIAIANGGGDGSTTTAIVSSVTKPFPSFLYMLTTAFLVVVAFF